MEVCSKDGNVKETHIDILDNAQGETIIETKIVRDGEGNIISETVVTTVTAYEV